MIGSTPNTARLRWAEALQSIADADRRHVEVLKRAALQRMALDSSLANEPPAHDAFPMWACVGNRRFTDAAERSQNPGVVTDPTRTCHCRGRPPMRPAA